jgi:septum formation protein
MAELVLASGSRSRADLLARLELPFVCERPSFDERAHDHRFAELGPREHALLLARGKARSVAARRPNDWILGADQLAVVDEHEGPTLLHKPGTEARAVDQLMRLRGRSHRLIGAIVLVGPGFEAHEIDEAVLTMRAFDEAEAREYVVRHQPLESVGAYHVEDAGIRLFEQIEGDYTGIIGLPLLAVCRLLRVAKLL